MFFNLTNPLIDICNNLTSNEGDFSQDNDIWASHRPMWLIELDIRTNWTKGKPISLVLHSKDLGTLIVCGIFYDIAAMKKEWTNRHEALAAACKEN